MVRTVSIKIRIGIGFREGGLCPRNSLLFNCQIYADDYGKGATHGRRRGVPHHVSRRRCFYTRIQSVPRRRRPAQEWNGNKDAECMSKQRSRCLESVYQSWSAGNNGRNDGTFVNETESNKTSNIDNWKKTGAKEIIPKIRNDEINTEISRIPLEPKTEFFLLHKQGLNLLRVSVYPQAVREHRYNFFLSGQIPCMRWNAHYTTPPCPCWR